MKITLQELHRINDKYPDNKDIHQIYTYDHKKGQWVFKGYCCTKCQRVFKRPGFIENHKDTCRPKIALVEKEPVNARIRTVNGDLWKPLLVKSKPPV